MPPTDDAAPRRLDDVDAAALAPAAPRLLPYQVLFALSTASISAVIALLGELRDTLGMSDLGAGVVVMSGFVAALVALVGLAPLADRGHGRRLVQIGLLLGAVGLVLMAFAPGTGVFVLGRAVTGFGEGMILPGVRRVAAVLDPAHVAENLGRLMVGEVVGMVSGPLLAGAVAEVAGLRTSLVVFALAHLAYLPFGAHLPADPGEKAHEHRTSLDLLRRRAFVGGLTMIGGYLLLLGAIEAVIPLQLSDEGTSTLGIGLTFAAFAIPLAAVSRIGGRSADRVGNLRQTVVGLVVVAVLTPTLGLTEGLVPVLVIFALFGLTDGFAFTAAQSVVSSSVPQDRQAAALGLSGAVEVGAAGLAALPAAAVYSAFGETVLWLVVTAAMLALVGTGAWLVRTGRARSAMAAVAAPPVPTRG
ncbi:MAG: MFS transporter [Acidimicrobiales bacterium]|nr:MFS transporter [Acidimicrobiales bacterium]